MYDAIIVGARVAGASTALLLARQGCRTLLLDRATFPSDTLSTHLIQNSGVALLAKWGLLDRLRATGCPAFTHHRLDFGAFAVEGSPIPADGVINDFYAPRRTVLDKLLIDAAIEAGAEFRDECTVDGILHTGSRVMGVKASHRGTRFEERARITIGADGKHSLIAKLVAAPEYDRIPSISCAYYSYWSGLAVDGLEVFFRAGFTFLLAPTHGNLTIVVMIAPVAEFPRIRLDIDQAFQQCIATIDGMPGRFSAAARQSQYFGTADQPNFYRRPFGDSWALVGDAGYHKDPCTAQGITDAFHQAELLTTAIHHGFAGTLPQAQCLSEYETKRNLSTRARYQLTCQMASQEPLSAEIHRILAALPGNDRQSSRFLGIFAGTVRCEDFFSPENIEDILNSCAGAGGYR